MRPAPDAVVAVIGLLSSICHPGQLAPEQAVPVKRQILPSLCRWLSVVPPALTAWALARASAPSRSAAAARIVAVREVRECMRVLQGWWIDLPGWDRAGWMGRDGSRMET